MSALAKAFFVSGELQAREVKLPDGSTHTLHFRELPAIEFRKFRMAEDSDDESVKAGSVAKLIAATLCEPDGKPAITYDQALLLTAVAANELVAAIMDINGLGQPGKA